jgi:O-antigen/teichoic acid export membrane protein
MRVGSAGLMFFSGLVCARELGLAAFGEYAVAIAWTNLLVIVAKLGMDTASLRFIPQYRARGESAPLCGFLQWSRRWTLAGSLAVAALMAGAVWVCRERLSAGLLGSLVAAAALLPVMVALQVREAALLAVGRVVSGQTSSLLTPLLLIVGVWVAPLVSGRALTPGHVVWIQCAAAAMSLGLVVWLGRRAMGATGSGETVGVTPGLAAEWGSVAWPLLLVQFLNVLQNQSGTLLCGVLLGRSEAGLYQAVARVAGVLFLGLQAINLIAAPTISGLYHAGRRAELERYLRVCCWSSGAAATGFALLMLLLGRFILARFGPAFVEGYVPMLVLLGGLAVASAAGPVNQLMVMTGRQWMSIRVFSWNAAAYVAASVVVLPQFGVAGAAVLGAASRLVSVGTLVYLARREHGLWCLPLWPGGSGAAEPIESRESVDERVAA